MQLALLRPPTAGGPLRLLRLQPAGLLDEGERQREDLRRAAREALRRLEKQKAIRILEYYAFKKKTEHNPCQRKPEGRTFPCGEWGIAVAEYRSR